MKLSIGFVFFLSLFSATSYAQQDTPVCPAGWLNEGEGVTLFNVGFENPAICNLDFQEHLSDWEQIVCKNQRGGDFALLNPLCNLQANPDNQIGVCSPYSAGNLWRYSCPVACCVKKFKGPGPGQGEG